MPDFLTQIIRRSTAASVAVRPRLPSRFEPVAEIFGDGQPDGQARGEGQVDFGLGDSGEHRGATYAGPAAGDALSGRSRHYVEHSDPDVRDAAAGSERGLASTPAASAQPLEAEDSRLMSRRPVAWRPAAAVRIVAAPEGDLGRPSAVRPSHSVQLGAAQPAPAERPDPVIGRTPLPSALDHPRVPPPRAVAPEYIARVGEPGQTAGLLAEGRREPVARFDALPEGDWARPEPDAPGTTQAAAAGAMLGSLESLAGSAGPADHGRAGPPFTPTTNLANQGIARGPSSRDAAEAPRERYRRAEDGPLDPVRSPTPGGLVLRPLPPAPRDRDRDRAVETTIKVTIGRVEVRAVPAVSEGSKPSVAPKVMTLEDYLRRAGEGRP